MTHAAFDPIWVGELDLERGIDALEPPADEAGLPYRRARLLVRVHGTPIGPVQLSLTDGRLAAEDVRREVVAQLGDRVTAHLNADGAASGPWDGGPLPEISDPACARPGPFPERAQGLASVIVCTRDRAAILHDSLVGILASDHPEFEVLVIDNAPTDDATRDVVEAIDDPRLRYVREPRGGLSPARNRAYREARGDLLVFTDDDVRVDPTWLRALLTGFTRAPHVGCVTGPVLGAELATPAQWYFESRVKWSKLLETRIYDLADHRDEDDPMYPFRAGQYGTGANFAVSRDAYRAMGGMDLALGVGSRVPAGEDLDFFLRLLMGGYAIAIEARATVWHWHRREVEALTKQMHSYGVGLSAFAFKHLLNPRTAAAIARRVPAALGTLRRDTGTAQSDLDAPEGLAQAELRGLLSGAPRYVWSRLRTPGAMPITGPRPL